MRAFCSLSRFACEPNLGGRVSAACTTAIASYFQRRNLIRREFVAVIHEAMGETRSAVRATCGGEERRDVAAVPPGMGQCHRRAEKSLEQSAQPPHSGTASRHLACGSDCCSGGQSSGEHWGCGGSYSACCACWWAFRSCPRAFADMAGMANMASVARVDIMAHAAHVAIM